ncbi:MAG: WD40 repeat domain-containing protein [Bacteroidota bacterium]
MIKKINVQKLHQFSGHKDCIYTVIPSLHVDCFYSGAGEGYVVEWNYKTKADGKLICQVHRPVYSLLLLKEQQQLLVGSAQGNLHVIDLRNNKEIRNIEAHQLGIFDIKLHNETIITTGGDGKVNIFDRHTFALLHTINESNKSARAVALNTTRNEMAIGYSDHAIRIFDLNTFTLKNTLQYHINSVFALSYCHHDKHLLSGGRDVFLKFFDATKNYELIKDIPAHTLHINSIQFSPDGNLFATVSMDKTLKIWDGNTFDLIKVIDKARNDAHITSINKVVWLNNNQLLTGSDDKTIMLWEISENVETAY